METRILHRIATIGIALVLACASADERAEQARGAIALSLSQGNRTAALEALDELQENLPDTADSLLEVAQLRVQVGDAPRAGWLLEAAVQRFPERDDLRLALASVSLLLGNPSLARRVVASIAAGTDLHATALVARAQAELNLGDLDAALATLAEAENLYPDKPAARLVRIATLLSERRTEEAGAAIEETRASLKGDQEETVALRRRLDVIFSQLQAQQGDTETALANLQGMVESDPRDVLAWRALIQVLAQQERSDEALARLGSALEAGEAPGELYVLAAQLDVLLGREQEAEARLRTFASLSGSPAAIIPLAEFHSERGNAEEVRRVLDEALGRFPEEALLRLLRTETLLALDQLDEARAEAARFQAATWKGDPQIEYLQARLTLAAGNARGASERLHELLPRLDRPATHFWLGHALEQRGDIEGARRRFRLAQQRDPSWMAPSAALVALEQRRGDWRASAGHAGLLVRQAPGEMGAWIALVSALENLGEGDAAEQVARRSMAFFPDQPEPHVLLAKSLRAQGKTDEALAALRAAQGDEMAQHVEAERVLTLGIGGRVAEGIDVARAALEHAPDSAALHAALASLLFAARATEEGTRATERALALDPEQPRPLRVRCEFRASSGNWSGARDDCTRYLEVRPDDSGAHFLLGVAQQSLGEVERAISSYRKAAELDERDTRSRNNLAELLAAAGDVDAALAAAQEAYRLDESSPYVLDTLGALYLRKGLTDRAISLLERAHAGLPDQPEVTLNLAFAYRDGGRTNEARGLLSELQQREQTSEPLRTRVAAALRSLP